MMGRTHALTGWCAGLAVAQFVGATSIEQAVLFAVTTSGFALLPDLDHPHARASKLLGPFSRALSWLLRHASAALYPVTKGPRDERKKGTHRHLSHTVLFAVGLGLAVSAGTEAGGPYAVAAVAVLGLLLAQDALGDWMIIVSRPAWCGGLRVPALIRSPSLVRCPGCWASRWRSAVSPTASATR